MNDQAKEIDERALFFAKNIKMVLRSQLSQIILFGSRARGDSTPASDYDFAIVLKEKTPDSVLHVRNTEVEFLNRFDILSSSLIYDENKWEKAKKMPIGINISREGIVL